MRAVSRLPVFMFAGIFSLSVAEAAPPAHRRLPLGASAAAFAGDLRVLHAPFQLIVDFPQINGLQPGSPVLVEGNLVGRVKKISSKAPGKNPKQRNRSFEVALDLDASISEKLALGTCALQALPMTDSRKEKSAVVELFVPQAGVTPPRLALLQPGDRIPGYSSYEEFWRSGTSRIGKILRVKTG